MSHRWKWPQLFCWLVVTPWLFQFCDGHPEAAGGNLRRNCCWDFQTFKTTKLHFEEDDYCPVCRWLPLYKKYLYFRRYSQFQGTKFWGRFCSFQKHQEVVVKSVYLEQSFQTICRLKPLNNGGGSALNPKIAAVSISSVCNPRAKSNYPS